MTIFKICDYIAYFYTPIQCPAHLSFAIHLLYKLYEFVIFFFSCKSLARVEWKLSNTISSCRGVLYIILLLYCAAAGLIKKRFVRTIYPPRRCRRFNPAASRDYRRCWLLTIACFYIISHNIIIYNILCIHLYY